MCQGNGPTEASGPAVEGGSSDRPSSSKRSPRPKDPTVIAAKEVLGRQIAVWSDKTMEWAKGTLAQFNSDTSEHLVRFNTRDQGSVKHEEKWVNLARTRFQWTSDPPSNAAPNPTYATAPRGDDAVGYRVRVFWPGMSRWYQGKVEGYSSTTKRHTVKYRDGDLQQLNLKHEAVVYLDKVGVSTTRRDRSLEGKKEFSGSDKKKERKSMAATGVKRTRGSAGMKGDGEADVMNGRRSKSARNGGRGTTPAAAPGTVTPSSRNKKRKTGNRHASTSSASLGDGDDQADSDDFSDDEGTPNGDSDQDMSEEDNVQDTGGDDSDNSDSDDNVKHRHHHRGRSSKRKSTGSGRKSDPDGLPRRRGRPPTSGAVSRRPANRAMLKASRQAGLLRRTRGDAPLRMPRTDEESIRVAGAAVVGCRVAVFWNDDGGGYYKGRLIQFDSYHKRHKIVYDDGEEEWVALPRETFRYLAPRAASAGCTAPFRAAMAQLGADQEAHGGRRVSGGLDPSMFGMVEPQNEIVADAPKSTEEAEGWRLSLRAPGDGRWYRAEVLRFDSSRGRHYLLYDDGEDEWVAIGEEQIIWHGKVAEDREGLFPGKAPAVEAPSGRGAVGWRVAVYWPGDAAFYAGEISGWDEANGKHEVSYDDGEEGTITLGEDRIKWILPPGAAVDHEALERMEVGGGRARRRVTATGGDSDPDYEFEQLHGMERSTSGKGKGLRGGRGRRPYGMRGGFGGPGRGMGHRNQNSLVYRTHGWEGGLPFQQGTKIEGDPHQAVAEGAGEEGGLAGQPVVVRQIHRVSSFANSSGDGDVHLPTAVTVRIYLSGNSSEEGSAAALADQEMGGPETGATSDPTTKKIQDRIKALDLMARRVGRAQQVIVKGVPTGLPTEAVRPLRLGPPVSVTRLMTNKTPGVMQSPRTLHNKAFGHRRGPGMPPSSFHRRRSLEEEDDEDDDQRNEDDAESDGVERDQEDEEEGQEEDCRNHANTSDVDNGDYNDSQGQEEDADDDDDDDVDDPFDLVGNYNGSDGGVDSSSGSSDDEDQDGNYRGSGRDGEGVVSPRSPTFSRGGKVKPSAWGGVPEPNYNDSSVKGDEFVKGQELSHSKTGIDALPGPKEFTLGDIPAADSVANLFSITRNVSAGVLLDGDVGGDGDTCFVHDFA